MAIERMREMMLREGIIPVLFEVLEITSSHKTQESILGIITNLAQDSTSLFSNILV